MIKAKSLCADSFPLFVFIVVIVVTLGPFSNCLLFLLSYSLKSYEPIYSQQAFRLSWVCQTITHKEAVRLALF